LRNEFGFRVLEVRNRQESGSSIKLATGSKEVVMTNRVLSISYDAVLLNTRAMMLQREGYTVTSAQTLHDAIRLSRQAYFDAAIIGHSIPIEDQMQMATAVRQNCPGAVLIALARREGERLAFADRVLQAQNPAEVVTELRHLLQKRNCGS
jgi:DNA-binding response OmpR family regulator